jgi:hypothetical protein
MLVDAKAIRCCSPPNLKNNPTIVVCPRRRHWGANIEAEPTPRVVGAWEGDTEMPAKYITPTVSAAPPIHPLLIPQPPIAPLVPPAHIVDLMTADGSAMFGAWWKANEAKIVECLVLTDSMPEFRTTYDIEPHAEITGFDDSDRQHHAL